RRLRTTSRTGSSSSTASRRRSGSGCSTAGRRSSGCAARSSPAPARTRSRSARQPPEHYNPLAPLLSRRMKQVAAELEFLKEFRLEFESWLSAQQRHPVEQPIVAESRRAAPKREKGPPRK